MARTVVVDGLLGLAVATALASAVGILVMRDAYRKLHYVTPIAIVAPILVGLAVLVQSGLSNVAAQTWLAILFMLIAGPYLSHATIRAARIRIDGDWRSHATADGSGESGEPQ
jgi:multisubunit Na+/H+ antiporter MnhG subunit